MKDLLLQSWWMLALRGVAALLFGVLALVWPNLTLAFLVALFAAYALVGGGAAIFGVMRHRTRDEGWWLILLLGLVSVGAGLIAIFHPALTALVLVLVMGANALVTGVLDIATAIRLRKEISNEWLLALSGLASIVFAVLVLLFPAAGALALVWLISAYAIVSGVLLLALAFRLRAPRQAWTGPERRSGAGDRRAGLSDRRIVPQ